MKPQITLQDVLDTFRSYNERNNVQYGYQQENVPLLKAYVVYSQSNFTREYSETSRTYEITSQSGKACFNGMIGNSLFGDCSDGTEQGVRLDYYNWKVERCYFGEDVF